MELEFEMGLELGWRDGWGWGGNVRVRAGRFACGVRVGRGTGVGIWVGLVCAKASRRMTGDWEGCA